MNQAQAELKLYEGCFVKFKNPEKDEVETGKFLHLTEFGRANLLVTGMVVQSTPIEWLEEVIDDESIY